MTSTTGDWQLVDERVRPSLRERLASRLIRADAASFAVARIRLGAIDLTEREIAGTTRWRVLLGELDAAMLLEARESRGHGPAGETLARLLRFARGGRLEVRSAGLASWRPDFAIVQGERRSLCALGAIYFGPPPLAVGPALAAITSDPATVRRLAERFEELWDRSHDVLPAILDVLEGADAVAMDAGTEGGVDPARPTVRG